MPHLMQLLVATFVVASSVGGRAQRSEVYIRVPPGGCSVVPVTRTREVAVYSVTTSVTYVGLDGESLAARAWLSGLNISVLHPFVARQDKSMQRVPAAPVATQMQVNLMPKRRPACLMCLRACSQIN
jgi:hypothetical protein